MHQRLYIPLVVTLVHIFMMHTIKADILIMLRGSGQVMIISFYPFFFWNGCRIYVFFNCAFIFRTGHRRVQWRASPIRCIVSNQWAACICRYGESIKLLPTNRTTASCKFNQSAAIRRYYNEVNISIKKVYRSRFRLITNLQSFFFHFQRKLFIWREDSVCAESRL